MNTIEYDIIDELYFVTNYNTLLEQVDIKPTTLVATLTQLLNNELIHQYTLNKKSNEFERMQPVNFSAIEQHAYLATKKGLLLHNGIE